MDAESYLHRIRTLAKDRRLYERYEKDLNAELVNVIVEARKHNVPVADIAEASGWSRQTIYDKTGETS